jgi:hypothetical protein
MRTLESLFGLPILAVFILVWLDTAGKWSAPGWLVWGLLAVSTAGAIGFMAVVFGGLLLGRWSDRKGS